MQKLVERRVSVRIPFVSKGVCHVHKSNKKHCGTLRDISINGAFMELNDCPKIGHRCDIDIIFEGNHSRLLIEGVGGSIIRSDEDGVAIHFDERLEWFILIPLYFHKMRDQASIE